MLAVQGVSSEPVSPEFPVKQGKNREFSQNQAVMGRIGCSNELLSHVFLVEFPKHRNREFFQPNREFKLQNRELSGGSGNRRTGPPQLQIGGPQPPLFAHFRSRTGEDPMTGVDVRYLPNFVRLSHCMT
ncbi:MAG: hypothetical protein IH786_06695 [Proteobacteria bacterium]|nr:hypothetical protein [Pseudomonadota bacterium]